MSSHYQDGIRVAERRQSRRQQRVGLAIIIGVFVLGLAIMVGAKLTAG